MWSRLTSFAHLLAAARASARGKRFRPPVLAFHSELEYELLALKEELEQKTYRPGPYRTFMIREPKPRLISAAPYRDRVIHHALTRVLEPIYERSFIYDSYACRQGKGTHAAMRRCQEFARRHPWVYKADIAKFFPSIDHAVLKGMLRRKIKDVDVLWLADLLIDHSNTQEEVYHLFPGDNLFTPSERRRGIPLGNQTSQFLANVYLDPLDHFVKERLRLPGYVRYVDDFVCFADSRDELRHARREIAAFLATLRLKVHPTKDVIFPARQGIRFVGYRVWGSHVKLVAENVYRFRRRLRGLQRRYARYEINWKTAVAPVASWIGHAMQADTFTLRERLFLEHRFRRAAAVPRVARRVVQQSTGERPLGLP